MKKTEHYRVSGMDCASCAAKVETAVRRIEGVSSASVSVVQERLTVTYDEPFPVSEQIRRVLPKLGYEVEEEKTGRGGNDTGTDCAAAAWWGNRKARLAVVSGAALLVAWLSGLVFPGLAGWVFGVALLAGLAPIARRAAVSALSGTVFSIEMLMTVAAVGAVLIGAAEEAAMVIFLFLIGELLEGATAARARASINKLVELMPRQAWRREADGSFAEVPSESLRVGEVIQARPGDRIAADGLVAEGAGTVNEAPVTGESVPVEKCPGDNVYAGTVNGEAALLVQVTAAAGDNTIARIIKLVEEAQESRAPMERFIERFARHYTPVVFGVALATALLPPVAFGGDWNEWIYKALALLLIGCPCALVISTPTAVAAGLAVGARRGLLMKGGVVLEKLGNLRLVAFDKTGTLTAGTPQVTDVLPWGGRMEKDVLAFAAALESGSSHPLALAILERNRKDGGAVSPAREMAALAGSGVVGSVGGKTCFLGSARAARERADDWNDTVQERIGALMQEGKTVSVLLEENHVAGVIALRDELRPDASAGVARLHAMGIRTVMLSGDNQQTARVIGDRLGMEVHAELLSEDKMRIVENLKDTLRKNEGVGLVGDGINDAPALARADVGIAMGGGTDVALETADAAILRNAVGDVARMIQLSRAMLGNIRQNIACALGLKALFLVTTLLGVTGLWPAILADTGASVLVTLNAMRLLRWRQ